MKYILILIFNLIYLLLYFFKLDSIPMIATDEGWNGLNADYEFGENKFNISSTLFSKIFFPYFFLLAKWMSIFDISLFSIRSLAVILGLISLNGFYLILKRLTLSTRYISVGMILFLVHNIFVVTFRWGRFEVLATTFMIWGLYFLIKAIQAKKYQHLCVSGFLFGCMVISLPPTLGVVIALLLFLWRFDLDTKKSYLYFILGGTIVVFFTILQGLIFQFEFIKNKFLMQSLYRINAASSDQSAILNNLIRFYQKYTLGIKRVYIFFFEIGIFMFAYFRYRKDKMVSTLSLVGLSAFVLSMILLSFETRYMGSIVVISILLAVIVILKEQKYFKKVAFLAVFIYFLNHFSGDLYFIHLHYKNTSYATISQQLVQFIPKGSRILSPIQFWPALHDYYTVTERHDCFIYPEKDKDITYFLNDSDYFIYAPYLLVNISPTSKTTTVGYDLSKDPFHLALKEAAKNNQWVNYKIIKANPYGNIYVYKKK